MVVILEFIIFIALMIGYFVAPTYISRGYLSYVVALAFSSYGLLYIYPKTKNLLKSYFLSNSNIFLLLYAVISFQFPIDYILNNSSVDFSKYFFNLYTVNLSVTFSALCFVAFIIGVMIASFNSGVKLQNRRCIEAKNKQIPTKPIFLIMVLLWLLFIMFMNPEYLKGGHGSVLVDNSSIAFYGYFWRMNILYLAIDFINHRNEKNKLSTIIRRHPPLYWVLIILSSALFLMAHNRVYTLFILVPTFFYIILILRLKTAPIKSMIILGIIAVFFTLFKVYGIDNMFSDSSNLDVADLTYYDRFSSISPFTSELAGSIYADSAMFNIWYNEGIVMFGSTIVLGVLRVISGLIPIFFMLTGLSDVSYSSGSFITKHLGASYGLGSTISGDSLLSLGFLPTIILLGLFGLYCYRCDMAMFINRNDNRYIIMGLAISSQIAFVERSSLCDVIATVLFCIIFVKIYKGIYNYESFTHN